MDARELRACFWAHLRKSNPRLYLRRRRGGQNHQVTDVRCAWVEFVDHMARERRISERIAQEVTL